MAAQEEINVSFHFPYGYVDTHELLDWVRNHPRPDGMIQPICLHGPPGIGKTQIIEQYAKLNDLGIKRQPAGQFKDVTDVIGIPFIDQETRRTAYAPPEWLPTEEWLRKYPKGGLLFIDEINRMPIHVMQAFFEFFDSGKISQSGWEMPPGWQIVAAANPADANYQTEDMDPALIARMLHYAPGWNQAGFLNYVDSNQIDRDIINLAIQNPDLMPSVEAKLPAQISKHMHMSPRGLDYLAALVEDKMEMRMLDTLARGLMGGQAAESAILDSVDPEKPLSGDDVLRGYCEVGDKQYPVQAYIDHWVNIQRPDRMRISTINAVAILADKRHPVNTNPQAHQHALNKMYEWLNALPSDHVLVSGVAAMRTNASTWWQEIQTLDAERGSVLKDKLPPNPQQIREVMENVLLNERTLRAQALHPYLLKATGQQ